MKRFGDKRIISWALYDWANSAFATTVISGFFPLFLKLYSGGSHDSGDTTFYLGAANSLASLVVAVLAPILGSIADRGGAKKRFLVLFATMAILMTGALSFVERGDWPVAVALYVIAVIGFSGGNVFYDALILSVADEKKLDRVSALGFSLGYLGGGLLFALNVVMTLWPEYFGLADSAQAIRVSFVMVAVWWAVFSIPLVLFVREPRVANKVSGWSSIREGLVQLAATFHEIKRLRTVLSMLAAYWLYIDGVHTIQRMAVDYGMALGFDHQDLIVAMLVSLFVGFPATMVFGLLGERLGARTGIYIGIGVYIGISVWAANIEMVWEFYVLAIGVGLVQGGVQSLSRSLFARIIPADRVGEFFGFYNMLGKFAAVLGPVMIGITSLATGDPRISILLPIVLFLAGGTILLLVNEREGVRLARDMERG